MKAVRAPAGVDGRRSSSTTRYVPVTCPLSVRHSKAPRNATDMAASQCSCFAAAISRVCLFPSHGIAGKGEREKRRERQRAAIRVYCACNVPDRWRPRRTLLPVLPNRSGATWRVACSLTFQMIATRLVCKSHLNFKCSLLQCAKILGQHPKR